MKEKGGKLPSVSVEGTSDAVFDMRDGRLVKVCPVCRAELDRATATCPKGPHA